MKRIGEGIYEYLYFVDEKKPYCKGIRNIKDLLNNKNKDKKLTNKDSFIVITGKLRIFNLLNFSDELKYKIELIDLPGFNRASNQFIKRPDNIKNLSYYEKMSYYEKILCFTNVCVFINKPENLDDERNKNKIQSQYIFNKKLLHPKIQGQFNETCLYIINQIDLLDKDTLEEDLKVKYENIIKEVDMNINNLSISFFSAHYYLKYLTFEKLFKENKTEQIEKIWEYFYEKYQNTFFRIFRRFGNIVINAIEKYENLFKIEFDNNLLDVDNQYKNEIIKVYSKMEKLPSLDDEEQNEIASHLYNFYLKLNDKNYNFFNVRKELIIDFENKISNANKLISRNYVFSLHAFFEELDPLFEDENKELKKEDEKNIEEYINKVQKESIPEVERILEDKRKSIIKIFDIVEEKIKNMIEKEKKNIKNAVKKNNEELKNEFMNFQQNVEFKIKEMEKQVNEEFESLGAEIKEYYDTALKSLNNGLLKYENSLNLIDSNIKKSLYKGYFLTGIKYFMFGNSASGIGLSIGIIATSGPIGIIFGIGLIAFFIGAGIFNYKGYSEWAQEYYDKYDNYEQNVEKNISDSKEKILKEFDNRKEIILKQLIINLEAIKLRLHASNNETYEKKCQEFRRIKKELKEKLQEQ